MFALAYASTKAARFIAEHPSVNHTFFYADNSSAIHTIFNPFVHSSQQCSLLFRHNVLSILDSSPQAKVTVKWSPGHAGVLGNERADFLAKQATPLPSVVGATFSYLRHRAKRRVKTEWKAEWNDRDHHGQFGAVDTIPPSTKVTTHFRNTPREVFGQITQLLTGHGYIGEYYMRFVPSESPWCPCTDEVYHPTLQTRDHLIFHCPLN